MTWRIAAAWFQERRSRTTPDAESESGHDIIETRMQRILVVLVILAVGIGGLAALWIFRGCEISSCFGVASNFSIPETAGPADS